MKTLVVAEKPSVARDIARVLGCRSKGEGFISGDSYIITWAIGHLVALCEPDEIDEAYKKWRVETLPILPERIPTKVIAKTKSQFAAIKSLMRDKQVSRIICATDSGREGELIFRFIYQKAGCTKPVDRLWISSMTDAAIRQGFENLVPSKEYDALYVSALCRAQADWIVGMNATRAFSLKYGAVLSIGRVQTPTLRLIVDRDLEIRDFRPEDYYEIRADFGDYQGLWQNPQSGDARIKDLNAAQQVKAETSGKTGRVVECETKLKKIPPPRLFDLTTLQREANRAMGISASKTLELAQALYERHKLITYPRTDSRFLPRDMIPKVKSTLAGLGEPYAQFAARLLPDPPVTGRVYDDKKVSDHHAIVPTGQKSGNLSPQEQKLYDMIVRRLICSHYPDYEYNSTVILTSVGSHVFKTTGQTPVKPGWRELYPDSADKSENLPNLKTGDERNVCDVDIKKCVTKPPSPHNDATLLGAMESAGKNIEDEALRDSMKDSGLGTPATRASIIDRLIAVGYIERKGKTLVATEKGIKLISVAPVEMTSAETTGKWERALGTMAKERDPANLEKRAALFMQSICRYSAFLVEFASKSSPDVAFEREQPARNGSARRPGGVVSLKRPCPVCGAGEVTSNQKAFGCSRWKEGCKFTVWKNALEKHGLPKLTVNDMKKLLDGKIISCDKGTIAFVNGKVVLNGKAAAKPDISRDRQK
ncbi:MAG: DNA topoisomerase III [Clostridia bacterium]|nr:DNA topoisomerase III [Clostridia bacterium]